MDGWMEGWTDGQTEDFIEDHDVYADEEDEAANIYQKSDSSLHTYSSCDLEVDGVSLFSGSPLDSNHYSSQGSFKEKVSCADASNTGTVEDAQYDL
ncbi:hypothetical protein PoB_001969900 [Plakobranchus ocellatus]|uniref:Uncharacterized protein n=1 Tax=Plakobranchus ocellatus TaxID=259542 RepID=A0AAV3ZCU0_9GAST|nr:hypothetical protein PoB_001969900 [Plakobranchus ocellatus]